MIDDLSDLAVAAAIDVATQEAAKRHRWARVLQLCIGLVVVVSLGGLIYLTFKYS